MGENGNSKKVTVGVAGTRRIIADREEIQDSKESSQREEFKTCDICGTANPPENLSSYGGITCCYDCISQVFSKVEVLPGGEKLGRADRG